VRFPELQKLNIELRSEN